MRIKKIVQSHIKNAVKTITPKINSGKTVYFGKRYSYMIFNFPCTYALF